MNSNQISNLNELTQWVKTLQNYELALFDRLFSGKEKKNISSPSKNCEMGNFNSISDVVNSTSIEEERVSRLIFFVKKMENDIQNIIKDQNTWERNENDKIEHTKNTKFINILDACLLIKDGILLDLIKNVEQLQIANSLVERYLTWYQDNNISTKLPEFVCDYDQEYDYYNIALFQQLIGKIPPSPIAHQILSFSLLDWQKNMFLKLKDGYNVICCAPTSSGKTMIAMGFIYAFLKNKPKSLLIYIAPNNILAMEISAILNKYVPDKVSTILDENIERKINERVVVLTPNGAFNHSFIDEEIDKDSFLVVDEVHCIGNNDGVNMEYCLRKFSIIQTLILSATMTQNTIQKLKKCIRNKLPMHEINETTRFMIPQLMIPKIDDQSIKLVSLNPVGSIVVDDIMNENLDIPMSPRDILSLYVKMIKVLDGIIPDYLSPVRFFFLYNCSKPESYQLLSEIESDETGIIRRLTLDDYSKWQKAIFNFLANPDENITKIFNDKNVDWNSCISEIINSFKIALTDDSTCNCSLENSLKLVEKLKEQHMLQALFFFPNISRAFKYATYIYKELASKPSSHKAERTDKERDNKIAQFEKQLSVLKNIKPKHGMDKNDFKDRRNQLEEEIRILKGQASSVQSQHSLSDNIISTEDSNLMISLLKKWNSNINLSSPLMQMINFGIGVLSGDMPFPLQVLIRKLYTNNILSILMVTEDCGYGINTPTKTVVLSDGFTESQRRQMAGRAGRKGISTNAWVIYFRLQNPEEAGQKLVDLKGNDLILYTNNKIPHEEKWITKISHQLHPYNFSREQLDKIGKFFVHTRTIYGHASILAPFVLEAAIKSTVGQTNRHISIILSIIETTPFNKPVLYKKDWSYELPIEVRKIFSDNGFGDVKPNYIAHLWLTNQFSELNKNDLELLVISSKYWSNLFRIMKQFFADNENNLFQQILDILVVSNIRTSTTI